MPPIRTHPLENEDHHLDPHSDSETESSKSTNSNTSSSNNSPNPPVLEPTSQLILTAATIITLYHLLHAIKNPYNTSVLTGRAYVAELLEGNKQRFLDMMRMQKDVFLKLCREISNTSVEPASKVLPLEEQLAIFMFIAGHSASNRATQDHFQHSGETISRVFHYILKCLLVLSTEYIKEPPRGWIHPTIESNWKFMLFFKNCIGALDGVHIPAHVPASKNPVAYRNCKGFLSQNVLGVCDFNLCFTYLRVGWEGSAHDARVLASARTDDFNIPMDVFYLADAGYGLARGILVPYRGVRYHLREQLLAANRPENKEELFNLRHAML